MSATSSEKAVLQPISSGRHWIRKVVVCLALLVVLALALGLGLGLGLHHHSSSSKSSNGNGTSADGGLVNSLQDSSAFVMNMSMVNEEPTTRFFDFVVEEMQGAPDGIKKPMLVVNGLFPGPTIEVNSGDRIVVNVTNKLSNSTAIHWHGLYQRGTPFYDGTRGVTQCGIPPGEYLVYNFTTEGWIGTTWWHAHYEAQYTDGIVGALVIHGKNESVPDYDGDVVIQVTDLYHDTSGAELDKYFSPGGYMGTPGNEPVPDGGTINGVGQYLTWNNDTFFNITLEANKTYRLRIINTGSFVGMQFSVDNHNLSVIEADGTATKPAPVSSVFPAIAQRYSVLLTTNQTAGAYWFRAALDQSAFTYTNPATQTEVRGVIRYGVPDSSMPDMSLLDNPPARAANAPPDLDPLSLVPANATPAPAATLQNYWKLSMQYPAGDDYFSHYLAFINETSWSALNTTATLFSQYGSALVDASATYNDSQLVYTIPEKQIMQIIIDNLDDGDHPLHLHGHKFWVMDQGLGRYQGGPLNNSLPNEAPMLRDTFIFPAYTWTAIRYVADNPGVWAFHCHIAWHMAAGLLYQINELPSESAKLEVPQYMLDHCKIVTP